MLKERFEDHGAWYYPNDRKPTEEEFGQEFKTDKEFLDIGPKFAAHYWARKSKEANDSVDVSAIRSRLLQVFCQRNINDEAMKHFDDIATEAYTDENE